MPPLPSSLGLWSRTKAVALNSYQAVGPSFMILRRTPLQNGIDFGLAEKNIWSSDSIARFGGMELEVSVRWDVLPDTAIIRQS